MKVGNYVLYEGYIWQVIKRHKKGTYQVRRMSGHHLSYWADMEVDEVAGTVVTKEVADVFIASNFNQPQGEVNEQRII